MIVWKIHLKVEQFYCVGNLEEKNIDNLKFKNSSSICKKLKYFLM